MMWRFPLYLVVLALLSRIRWFRVLAIAIGVLLALWLLSDDRSPEASEVDRPGYVLASGPLDAAEHEAASGYFNVGKFSIAVPPEGIPATQLRLLRGRDVEIVIREREPRALKRIER